MEPIKPLPLEAVPEPGTPPPANPARQWTYEEVAALKRVTRQTVMEWVKKGIIPSPIYTGYTARFSDDQVATILCGIGAPGTYPVTPSPRSAIGKLGGSSKKPKKGKALNPAQRKKLEANKGKKLEANKGKKQPAKKGKNKPPPAKKAKGVTP